MEKLHFANTLVDTALVQTGVLGLLGHVDIGVIASNKHFTAWKKLMVFI
jgi:hypothetical protein